MTSPLQRHGTLGDLLGVDLFIKRDDLLPFPLAGNKVRKIRSELRALRELPDLIVTTGSVDSNHCRTTAWIAAELGLRAHLVLHGDPSATPKTAHALAMLELLGADYTIVDVRQVAETIDTLCAEAIAEGRRCYSLAGGCHTPHGAIAYRDVGVSVFRRVSPDLVFVASGTGATHGGLVAAAERVRHDTRVVGISVARRRERGVEAVRQAAAWAGSVDPDIIFNDDFIAGGYGATDERTHEAVRLGWQFGVPLDGTYTGKAFAGMLDLLRSGSLRGARVLFWHTGGLWNQLDRLVRSVP